MRRQIVDDMCRRGAVAVVRLNSVEQARDAVSALAEGGVSAIEVTLTTPGALSLITALAGREGLLVGAGSVLTAEQARQAVDAGARYVVSPVFDADVLATAHTYDVPALPGAYTPTEMMRAYLAGADLVKVFPADTLGPSYLKAVLAPMPFLELMPTGGVTPDNVGTWLGAGAVAVGLGGSLVDAKLVAARDWAALTARARRVSEAVAAARPAESAP
ncbi:MAG: bifunctional 4-hydroxy-2-oxoglutarate aldolase/2-dehydro-3-deoxy-phosphogluconate aldolase [Gemmatimonadaceae bacterium]|nr:bifunctional 4-hydroxy-2-oxoglutarate aldolase/2-dehydro-3-deoxy-phosphogluconate aldolase [Gemmatimonadaceae bacterium]